MVAQSVVSYDEGNYPLVTYGNITSWTDPQTIYRGNATTAKKWVDIGNTWLETHTQYDQAGNVVNAWDAKGNLSQISYSPTYSYAYPTQTTSAVPDPSNTYGTNTSLTVSSGYDAYTGMVTSTTDANGKTSTFEYNNPLNRQTRVNLPDGGYTRKIYVASNLCGAYVETRTLLDSSGHESDSWVSFDGLGRPYLTQSYDPQDSNNPYLRIDTQYDSMGRAWRVSDPYRSSGCTSALNPSGRWTQTTFDALSRPIQTLTTADNAVVTTTYSASTSGILGTSVTMTDAAGKTRRNLTDVLNRLVRVDEPDANGSLGDVNNPAQPTSYTYDTLSNLRLVTQGGQSRYFMCDSLGRVIRAKTPEQDANSAVSNITDGVTGNTQWSVAYGYDYNSNLTARVDARNITTSYGYDALNRSTSVTYSDGTPAVYRYYDSATNGRGRLYWDQAVGVSANVFDSYDAMGRPTQMRQRFWLNGSWGESFKVSRTYDYTGHALTQTGPSGHTVNYAYDLAGRISSFSGNLGDGVMRTYSTGLAFSEFGGMQQEQFGTSTPLYHKLHYNVRGQLYDTRLSSYSLQANEWDWNRGR